MHLLIFLTDNHVVDGNLGLFGGGDGVVRRRVPVGHVVVEGMNGREVVDALG